MQYGPGNRLMVIEHLATLPSLPSFMFRLPSPAQTEENKQLKTDLRINSLQRLLRSRNFFNFIFFGCIRPDCVTDFVWIFKIFGHLSQYEALYGYFILLYFTLFWHRLEIYFIFPHSTLFYFILLYFIFVIVREYHEMLNFSKFFHGDTFI